VLSIRRAPRPLCVYYVQGARQARKKVNKRRCRSKPVFVWTPPLVSVAQSCVRHHSQYHHRHPHVQVCHVALFKLWHRRLWLSSWWWVCCFLPPLLGSLLHHASSSRQASSSPCPLWSCPLAREGHPHGRDLCGLACAESEDLTLMASGFFCCTLGNRPQTLIRPPSHNMHALLCCLASAAFRHHHSRPPKGTTRQRRPPSKQRLPCFACLLST
jgi:hypothetical protein